MTPLAELHVHLEGTAPPALIRRTSCITADCTVNESCGSTGSWPARKRTPWCSLGKNPAPHKRENSGWSVRLPEPWEIMTTNAGKFWFSVPRP